MRFTSTKIIFIVVVHMLSVLSFDRFIWEKSNLEFIADADIWTIGVKMLLQKSSTFTQMTDFE